MTTYRRTRTRYRWAYGPDRARAALLELQASSLMFAASIYQGIAATSPGTSVGAAGVIASAARRAIGDERARAGVQAVFAPEPTSEAV